MNTAKLTAHHGPAVISLSSPWPWRVWHALGEALAAWRARRAARAALDAFDRLDAHTLRDIGLGGEVIDAVREHRRAEAERWLGRGGGAY